MKYDIEYRNMKYGLFLGDECITTCEFNEWCSYNTPFSKAVKFFCVRKCLNEKQLFDLFYIKEIK